MSQGIFSTIVPTTTSGNQLATILNDFKEAVVSGFSGSSRPSELDPGGYWVDTSNPNLWLYKMYSGVSDITIFSVNLTTGLPSITGADTNFEIIKISADSVGPALRLVKERIATNGQTLVGDVLGEIQFYGTRDSGTNVVTATIKAVATDETTASAQGTYLSFLVSADGSAAMTEAMRLIDGKLGIGITAPTETIHALGNAKLEREVDDANATQLKLRKKRVSGSGQVLSSDLVGSVEFLATDDTGTEVPSAIIETSVRENQTSSAHGSKVVIKNKKLGETSYTSQVTIEDDVTVNTNLIVTGDLTVSGTNTILNTQTIEVEDANIILNNGGTQASANAAKSGFTVEMSDFTHARVGYDSSKNSKFVAGNVGSEKEIITDTDIQTLQNKTFDADLNTLSNVDNGNIKSGADIARNKLAAGNNYRVVVNDATGIMTDASAITASRVLISDANGIPTHSSVTNTTLGYLDATSSIQTQLNGKVNATGGTLTSGSVVTPTRLDVKQDTFANLQTYAATATNGQLAFATDQKKMYQVVDNALTEVGGAGVGGVNYIDNYNFENDDAGWVEYADAADVAPVDGTGGVANTTFTRTTSLPLRETGSGLITKNSGVSRQGEGVAYAFTIDRADQAQILRISFDYDTEASTTNYVDGDIRIYVYDVTNFRLIEVVDRDLLASAQGKFVGTFQSSPDSLSYRLIFHIAGTGTTAWTVKIDNVIVGPQTIVKGAIVKEQYAYLTLGSLGIGTVIGALTGSEGEGLFSYNSATGIYTALKPINVQASFTARATGTALPVAPTIIFPDNSFVATSSDAIATAWATASGTSFVNIGETFSFSVGGNTSSTNRISVVATYVSPNVTLSEDAGNREIATRVWKSGFAQVVADGLTNFKVDFSSAGITYDTAACWNSSTQVITIPETGIYDIFGTISFGSGVDDTSNGGVQFFLNGATYTGGAILQGLAAGNTNTLAHSSSIRLNKGDTVELYGYWNDITSSNSVTITAAALTIAKRSSPQTIAASEVVYVRASSNSGSLINNTTSTIIYNSVGSDTHNAYNSSTGFFTAPQSGYYQVNACFLVASAAGWQIGETYYGQIIIGNDVAQRHYHEFYATPDPNAVFVGVSLSGAGYMSKGQIAYVEFYHNNDASLSIYPTSSYNKLNIIKVG